MPSGTPIGAACDGVVSFVGYDDIYGNMVKIKHDDNTETIYAHASYILTELGKEVKKKVRLLPKLVVPEGVRGLTYI